MNSKLQNMHLLPWHHLLFLAMVATTLVVTTASITPKNMITAANTTKPGCQQKCGNLTIPYPFGIGHNCYLEEAYAIICNTSYNPPRAIPVSQYGSDFTDILDITETQITIRNNAVTSRCYDSEGNVTSEIPGNLDMIGSPFSVSTENRLTVIGCDEYALLEGQGVSATLESAGCIALCNTEAVTRGSCLGSGCCETPILAAGWQELSVRLSSLHDGIGRPYADQPTCSYAFFARNGSFEFGGTSDITGAGGVVQNRILQEVPIVLDWNIQLNTSCREAKQMNSTDNPYFCQSNTECFDTYMGYRCRCLRGYEGNPYLQSGCKDINECAAGTNNPCTTACVNTVGGYRCSCPRGYSGDGQKSGSGCVRNPDKSSSTLKKITLGLGISLGTILLLLVGWWFSSVIKKRRIIKQKAKYFERNGGMLLEQQMATDESVVARLKIFTADELDKATDHFNEDRIIGQGGQGTVYKGMLSEGKIVAIKKAKKVDESQLGGFINEVVISSQINHRNIVKLLGCCLETEVPILVYEFIQNGTLFHHIHNPSEEFSITWRMRLQIASDSAGALAYLHSSSAIPILHRDIKSSNILLDDKYRGKLSDFGTSLSISIDQTHVTTRVMGTFGYLDPEYFQSSMFTEKSDVYSFGVVLVELITGQKAIRATLEEDRSLTSWFLSHMKDSRLQDIVDSEVLQEGSEEELQTIANLAMRCLNLDGKKRPTMKEVLIEIEGVISLHFLERNRKNGPETEETVTGKINHMYEGHGYSSSSAFYKENSSLCSAEMSLLFNPR
ncbi:wall-associated receptor kinase 2 [Spinacia oleracea]|uniref:Wall-associated receptor kinase 2 n=1 Tax=Spinacia oleracea TaxID=3562 RepID=A0A9R0J4Y2_SPIOL|nr:wall-associated receptor kinase 2-like [Spinacia oleracea]